MKNPFKWYPVFDDFRANVATHPTYAKKATDWVKYRSTYEGGRPFITKYLKPFSKREDGTDFSNRRDITYCPAHAKAAIVDIKNAIYQRMVDITRTDGPNSWQQSIQGEHNGVDYNGNSLSGFIGRLILPELLSMAKVGVYVDKDPMTGDEDANDTKELRPYLYMYKAEDIRSWSIDRKGKLTSILLRDTAEQTDEGTGLVTSTVTEFRHLRLTPEGVVVNFYDEDGKLLPERKTTLTIKRIPFVLLELSQSLLIDVADYQIALLNLGSSDINYSIKSNYPFYVEQFDPMAEMAMIRQATSEATTDDKAGKPGESDEAQKAKEREVQTGVSKGRRYPKGFDAPAFIHPSPEPLKASMAKQAELRTEIRQLVNLAVTNLQPVRASAESKKEDDKSLEAGLSYIGMELEFGERQISQIWSEYEGGESANIHYPRNYSLRTDADRMTEAKELEERRQGVPSITYQKELTIQMAAVMVGHKVTADKMSKIIEEIDTAKAVITDHETIRDDHEAGLVSDELASSLAGYPKGEVKKAQEDHAARAARILLAQTSASDQARGVEDTDPDDKSGELEKKKVLDLDPDNDKGQRGKGK